MNALFSTVVICLFAYYFSGLSLNIDVIHNGWLRSANLLAFPYAWQRPANTEEWVYKSCLTNGLKSSKFYEVICFPWATLIDLRRKLQSEKADFLIGSLENVPPKKTLIRATVCQHIYALDMLEMFEKLKITDLFWSHATSDILKVRGIRIHPFPLFPVACETTEIGSVVANDLRKRKYLYSFLGAYDEGLYLTPVRDWIFNLKSRPDAIVLRRDQWHFEKMVYGEQVYGVQIPSDNLTLLNKTAEEYKSVLSESIFGLCPSGSGPNSIRLWESIGFGCIPVIISDKLRLPGCFSVWRDAAIFIPECESAIREIPTLLENVVKDEFLIGSMQKACDEIWRSLISNGPSVILSQLDSSQFLRGLLDR